MKLIVDLEKKSLRILENERSIFRGEYGADKLELYINKQLVNEYPTITALLSNGRKIGAYSTDEAYGTETIDGVTYTVASFTLSKENGFTLSEGQMQITIWMNTSTGKKEAIGNVTLNVINTTAFDDGDIIVSGDVEGTIVNYKVELENLGSQVNTFNGRLTNVETDTKKLTGKLKGFTDLGTFDLGFSVDSPINELNSVQDSGMYFFRYKTGVGTFTCFMIVQYRSGTITQTIFERYDSESKTYKCTIRTSGILNWIISSFELTDKSYVVESIAKLVDDAPETFNTLNKLAQALKNKADTTYVDEKVANLVNSAPETLDTLGEIAQALQENDDVVDALNKSIANKADKTEIPTKLSQLEQDVELGVDAEQVMEIVESNSQQVETLSVGTSNSYNEESDNEIPTTKTVKSMIDSGGSSGGGKLYKHNIEIYQASEYVYVSYIDNNPEMYSGNVTQLLDKLGTEITSTLTYSFNVMKTDYIISTGVPSGVIYDGIISYQKRYDEEEYSWYIIGRLYDGETYTDIRKKMFYDVEGEWQKITDEVEEF